MDDATITESAMSHVRYLLLALQANRAPGHPRLPPELLEYVCYEFCDSHRMLDELCAAGNVRALQHWHTAYQVTDLTPVAIAGVWEHACVDGQLAVAQWLHQTFTFPHDTTQVLRYACMQGHVHMARWLHDAVGLRDNHPASLLLGACTKGHLALAQWLADAFAQRLNLAGGNHMIRFCVAEASKSGALSILQWLHQTFPQATRDSIHHDAHDLLADVCHYRLGKVVRWMHRTFGLSETHVMYKYRPFFRDACGM